MNTCVECRQEVYELGKRGLYAAADDGGIVESPNTKCESLPVLQLHCELENNLGLEKSNILVSKWSSDASCLTCFNQA